MKFLFWLSLGLIVYQYAGYPLLLYLIGKLRPRPVKRHPIEPHISIVIAAHNEEANLGKKLENTLALAYPKEKCDIIVVSDGSTDQTEEIAESFTSDGVICLTVSHRSGKSAALNEGLRHARGDIIVFSDVAALAAPDCLQKLIADFADPEVGCVSTQDCIADGNGGGEGAYVRYEMLLRQLESRVGSCVAVSGSFYAIRSNLCPYFSASAATDLASVIATVRHGSRVISEPRAVAHMATVASKGDEFQRKVRTVLTGLSCLPDMLPLLNPLRYGFFSIEMISHKLLRWFGGIFLVTLLLSSAFLASNKGYAAVFAFQLVIYALALVGACFSGLSERFRFVRLPLFFVLTNLSALIACWKYVRGERAVVWQPSKRVTEVKE